MLLDALGRAEVRREFGHGERARGRCSCSSSAAPPRRPPRGPPGSAPHRRRHRSCPANRPFEVRQGHGAGSPSTSANTSRTPGVDHWQRPGRPGTARRASRRRRPARRAPARARGAAARPMRGPVKLPGPLPTTRRRGRPARHRAAQQRVDVLEQPRGSPDSRSPSVSPSSTRALVATSVAVSNARSALRSRSSCGRVLPHAARRRGSAEPRKRVRAASGHSTKQMAPSK